MKKTYKLLIESPELKKGTVVTQDASGSYSYEYDYIFNGCVTRGKRTFQPHEVEDRAEVWQLQEPPQEEKKIVERERVGNGDEYFLIAEDDLSTDNALDTHHVLDNQRYDTGNYFKNSMVCTRAGRRASVMFQLMNIAEEVERGSTECRGGWYVISRIDESKTDDRKIIIYHTRYTIEDAIASFSTRDLAQLFHDSATDLLREWYGMK